MGYCHLCQRGFAHFYWVPFPVWFWSHWYAAHRVTPGERRERGRRP
jgi:hypothetical protein